MSQPISLPTARSIFQSYTSANNNASPTQAITQRLSAAESVKVTLSAAAQKRLEAMNRANEMLKTAADQVEESSKAAARERIKQIKKQIEALQKLIIGLSPKAAKGVLMQIRQMAQELRQLAKTLAGGGADSAGSIDASAKMPNAPEASSSEEVAKSEDGESATEESAEKVAALEEKAAKAAESEASESKETEKEAEDAPKTAATANDHNLRAIEAYSKNQENGDSAMIKDVLRKLKQLFALLKVQVEQGDPEAAKAIKEVENEMKETEKLANSMNETGLDSNYTPITG